MSIAAALQATAQALLGQYQETIALGPTASVSAGGTAFTAKVLVDAADPAEITGGVNALGRTVLMLRSAWVASRPPRKGDIITIQSHPFAVQSVAEVPAIGPFLYRIQVLG